MIDAKSFMEFFEREYGVQFIDAKMGKRVQDIMPEKKFQKNIPIDHPAYRSDYDEFLESGGDIDEQ